jgi:hypothetical protein
MLIPSRFSGDFRGSAIETASTLFLALRGHRGPLWQYRHTSHVSQSYSPSRRHGRRSLLSMGIEHLYGNTVRLLVQCRSIGHGQRGSVVLRADSMV